MSPLFGTKYDDGELCDRAEQALVQDPVINSQGLEATSEDGVVRLTGRVTSDLEKQRAVRAVQDAFETAGLEYERIDDQIQVA